MTIIAMACAVYAIWLSLSLGTGVHAQSTTPTNDTSQLQGDVGFLMSTTINNVAPIKIVPLTNSAGLSGTADQLQAINPSGPLFLTNGNTVNQLQPRDIAYISCEPGDYPGVIDASRTINLAASNRPVAIVLFTEYAVRCNFNPTDTFQYTTIYTTEDSNSSSAVLGGLLSGSPPNPNTSIHVDPSTINGTSNGSGGGSVLGRSPSTAVAMIILYSITGIITALFLIIIIVGAIRAHRHPERYGPRRIVGRQRQGRAKGIARAMLETLPIVKFGDLEDEQKPAEPLTDMELGVTNPRHAGNPPVVAEVSTDHAEGSHAQVGEGTEPVKSTTTEAAEVKEADPETVQTIETGTPAVDNGLACSVCVEDFEKGQNVRVLPCKHRFHPDCIDPWLLNVSGTCPLCRTDLRPTASHGDNLEIDGPAPPSTTSLEDATSTAAFNESTRRNRRSRILHTLNIGHMRNATPEERLAALRMLRNEDISGDSTPRPRNRFTQRLGRTFGSRPHSGAGTPRRHSGASAAADTLPTADAYSTIGMESTTEEPSAAGNALPMADLPPPLETPHEGEKHTADAPNMVESIPTVEVTRPSAEMIRSQEKLSTADAQTNEEEQPTTKQTPRNDGATIGDESPEPLKNTLPPSDPPHPTTTTTPASSSSPASVLTSTHTNPTAPAHPSEPKTNQFYSYR